MKISNFLLIILSLVYLTGCGGSDNVRSDLPDTDRVLETLTVGADGVLNYTGTGDFEGFTLSLNDTSLAGRTVYVEKTNISGTVDNYNTLSYKYSVRFTPTETDETSVPYNAAITLPYTLRDSATHASTVLLTLLKPLEDKDAVLLSSTKPSSGTIRAANATIPAAFFAGYAIPVVIIPEKEFIKFVGKSSFEARNDGEFADELNNAYPDRIRAIPNVQPGEKVTLDIDAGAFGGNIALNGVTWSVTRASGGTVSFTTEGNTMTFIPTTFENYTVNATVVGVNTTQKTQSVIVYARAYSYNKDTGESYCMMFCHSGSIEAPEFVDVYGREIMRPIIDFWQESGHAGTQKSGSSCAECHSTGAFKVDRTAAGSDQFADAFGYDDVTAPDNAHLTGVTCEACHGPSAVFTGGLNGTISFNGHPEVTSIDSGSCLSCHEHGRGGGSHFAKFYVEEDNENISTHEGAHTVANFDTLVMNDSCFKCHTGQGAIAKILGVSVRPADFDKFSGITCNVCHDPHGEGDLHAQLRKTGNTVLKVRDVDHTLTAGNSFVCYQCHNTDNANVGDIPHNAQAEMYEGIGGYTYGQTLNLPSFHKPLRSCVECHMALPNASKSDAKTHVMNMTVDLEERIAACNTECHVAFNLTIVDGGYELNGKRAEITALMTELRTKINTLTGKPIENEITVIENISGNQELTDALNYAAYNYNFIRMDRSSGAHNFRYTQKLLELSLEDLERF